MRRDVLARRPCMLQSHSDQGGALRPEAVIYREATMQLDWPARILGFHLGLGDLQRSQPCMGYQNACVCTDCREREIEREAEAAKATPRQPWEPTARNAA